MFCELIGCRLRFEVVSYFEGAVRKVANPGRMSPCQAKMASRSSAPKPSQPGGRHQETPAPRSCQAALCPRAISCL